MLLWLGDTLIKWFFSWQILSFPPVWVAGGSPCLLDQHRNLSSITLTPTTGSKSRMKVDPYLRDNLSKLTSHELHLTSWLG